MEFILNDLRGDYVQLVRQVAFTGKHVETRGLETRELTAVTLIFKDVTSPLLPLGVGRGVNSKLAAIEALQLISGVQRHDLIQAVTPKFDAVLVDSQDPNYGAYGPRIIEQLGDCLDVLYRDPTTRRAVITIWNEKDLTHHGDRPCTVFLQFLVRDNGYGPALELHTHMRSQDVWLGVPYDIFMFTQLQHTAAYILGLPTGQFVHHATSLHIYETDVLKIEGLDSNPAPLDHDLPLGVVSGVDTRGVTCGNQLELNPLDVASYLLEDSANELEIAQNPWYANVMGAVHAKVNA